MAAVDAVLERALPTGYPIERAVAAVTRIVAAGRAAWPELAADERPVAEALASRLRDDPELELEQLRDADLYLAIALAGGDRAAIAVFEARLVPQIEGALRRLRLPSDAIAELAQGLRADLLVGNG